MNQRGAEVSRDGEGLKNAWLEKLTPASKIHFHRVKVTEYFQCTSDMSCLTFTLKHCILSH